MLDFGESLIQAKPSIIQPTMKDNSINLLKKEGKEMS